VICIAARCAVLRCAVLCCATQSTSSLLRCALQAPLVLHEKYWLDFHTNKYKPYALQGGATDLHMPFVAQVTLPLRALLFCFWSSAFMSMTESTHLIGSALRR